MPRPNTPINAKSQPISPAAFGQIRAYLATAKNPATGQPYTQAWIDNAIGTVHGGRDMFVIAELLAAAL